MKKVIFGLFLFFAIFLTHNQVNAEWQSKEDFTKWMMFYYLNPQPEKISSAIQYLNDNKFLDNKKAFPPTFGFLSGIFENNESQAMQWMEDFSSWPDSKYGVLVLGLWYTNLPNAKTSVYTILEERPGLKKTFNLLFQGSPISVIEIPLEQGAWVLDSLWGNFMATGSNAPVLKVMEALPWLDAKGDTKRLVIGGAAQWSLTSNAIQHKKIMEICEAQRIIQSEDVARKLTKIINSAKKNSPL